MKALYRRYRPMKLEEVVGQPQVTEPLISALKSGKINHAYLFIGPRGCGKTSVARILAHEINGFNYEAEDDYVDIIEIDGASNRGIDNIRDLREKVAIAPTAGKYKVYIIDEVHMLTKEAFNALLKTLEEPPQHAVFILATTDAYKIPATITSRTQVFTFKLADAKVMHAFLAGVAAKESIQIDDDALDIIVRRGGGSFRDSLSLLDQISTISDQLITKDAVIKAMGLPSDDMIAKLIDAYIKKDQVLLTSVLRELMATGTKSDTITLELMRQIIESPSAELMPLLAKLADVKPPHVEARLTVALLSDILPANKLPANKPETSKPIATNYSSAVAKPAQVTPVQEVKIPDGSSDSPKNLEPSTQVAPEAESQPNDFNWDHFVETVQGLNDAVYTQLTKTLHEFRNNELLIYPQRGIVKTILSRENNKRILIAAAGNVKITICDVGDTPSGIGRDETLSKISAIMGGEVRNDGGTSPF